MKTLFTLILLAASSQAATITYLHGGAVPYSGFNTGIGQALVDGNLQDIICIEINQFVTPGETYTAALLNGNISPYARLAWLAEQMYANPGDTGAIQLAIWNIGAPGTVDTVLSNSYLAASVGKSPTLLSWQVIHSEAKQDFLTHTPEPATFAGVGLVLFGLGYIRKRCV